MTLIINNKPHLIFNYFGFGFDPNGDNRGGEFLKRVEGKVTLGVDGKNDFYNHFSFFPFGQDLNLKILNQDGYFSVDDFSIDDLLNVTLIADEIGDEGRFFEFTRYYKLKKIDFKPSYTNRVGYVKLQFKDVLSELAQEKIKVNSGLFVRKILGDGEQVLGKDKPKYTPNFIATNESNAVRKKIDNVVVSHFQEILNDFFDRIEFDFITNAVSGGNNIYHAKSEVIAGILENLASFNFEIKSDNQEIKIIDFLNDLLLCFNCLSYRSKTANYFFTSKFVYVQTPTESRKLKIELHSTKNTPIDIEILELVDSETGEGNFLSYPDVKIDDKNSFREISLGRLDDEDIKVKVGYKIHTKEREQIDIEDDLQNVKLQLGYGDSFTNPITNDLSFFLDDEDSNNLANYYANGELLKDSTFYILDQAIVNTFDYNYENQKLIISTSRNPSKFILDRIGYSLLYLDKFFFLSAVIGRNGTIVRNTAYYDATENDVTFTYEIEPNADGVFDFYFEFAKNYGETPGSSSNKPTFEDYRFLENPNLISSFGGDKTLEVKSNLLNTISNDNVGGAGNSFLTFPFNAFYNTDFFLGTKKKTIEKLKLKGLYNKNIGDLIIFNTLNLPIFFIKKIKHTVDLGESGEWFTTIDLENYGDMTTLQDIINNAIANNTSAIAKNKPVLLFSNSVEFAQDRRDLSKVNINASDRIDGQTLTERTGDDRDSFTNYDEVRVFVNGFPFQQESVSGGNSTSIFRPLDLRSDGSNFQHYIFENDDNIRASVRFELALSQYEAKSEGRNPATSNVANGFIQSSTIDEFICWSNSSNVDWAWVTVYGVKYDNTN